MNTFLFACLCWRKKLTLEKQVNFYKPHAVFKLIYTNDMQVALALKAHAIWLVFENFSFWFIPNCTRKRVITYTNCFENYLPNFVLNELSACELN